MAGIQIENKGGVKGNTPSPQGASPAFMIAEGVKALLNRMSNTFKVNLPENHYSPEGSDQFDIRVVGVVQAGATEVLMSYRAENSQTIRFIKYGMFTNILLATNVTFFPTKDGSRILRYHGDPNDDFKLNFSVGPDLTENSLITCDVTLRAGEELRWTVTNNGTVGAEVGVRMKGFLVNDNSNGNRGFGG